MRRTRLLGYFRHDGATCRETAALSSSLGTRAGASPCTTIRADAVSPVMLYAIFYNQVIGQKLSQSITAMPGKLQQSHEQK